jgi:GT2 family glycosyltransferase
MARTDIIIPHYGTGRLTDLCLACLQSIERHSLDYRVILVDNASPEFSVVADQLGRIPHLAIRNTVNLGFIKAVNQGIRVSNAQYIVLMNNDTEAVDGWLDKLRRPLNRWPIVGLSGPLTTTPDSWQGKWKARGAAPHLLAPARMLAFFCVMIRRSVFEKIGVLDESYGVGFGDDDEYCRRAERAGIRLALVQDLVIPHHHRSTFKTLYSGDEIQRMQDQAMAKFKGEINAGRGNDGLDSGGERVSAVDAGKAQST